MKTWRCKCVPTLNVPGHTITCEYAKEPKEETIERITNLFTNQTPNDLKSKQSTDNGEKKMNKLITYEQYKESCLLPEEFLELNVDERVMETYRRATAGNLFAVIMQRLDRIDNLLVELRANAKDNGEKK